MLFPLPLILLKRILWTQEHKLFNIPRRRSGSALFLFFAVMLLKVSPRPAATGEKLHKLKLYKSLVLKVESRFYLAAIATSLSGNETVLNISAESLADTGPARDFTFKYIL